MGKQEMIPALRETVSEALEDLSDVIHRLLDIVEGCDDARQAKRDERRLRELDQMERDIEAQMASLIRCKGKHLRVVGADGGADNEIPFEVLEADSYNPNQ